VTQFGNLPDLSQRPGLAVNGMTAFELRNVVSHLLGMVPQSILSRHAGGLCFPDQRLKIGADGTGAIDQDTGSDEASITYA
jgi:hypothetical protein